MANMKHVCKCGGICVWNENKVAPQSCAFCKAPFGKVALRKLRSLYSGNDKQQMMNLSVQRLGAGVDRQVYALSDTEVVKFGKTKAIKMEVERWNTAPNDLKKWLAPVIDWDEQNFEWMVMARANDVGNWNNVDAIPWTVREKVGDCHQRNVGKINGEVKIIDYVGGGVDWL